MKNDTQIKVTCITNDKQKDEFHFDYYDKEWNMVGTVSVDETGKVDWSIWNKDYESNILYNVSCILGKTIDDSSEYHVEGQQPDPIRWDNAQEYIDSKGLVVNYQQKPEFTKEFFNGRGK